MKFEVNGDKLRVSEISELGANSGNALRDRVRASLTADQKHIEVDLSETSYVDSCGLGVLIALHKTACSRKGELRVFNPRPPVRQILDLTRMSRIFEIVDG